VRDFEFFVASLDFVEFHDEICIWILSLSLIYMSTHVCVLVFLNACVFTAYSISCIRSRVYMFLNSNFHISILALSSITKKGNIVAI
jgi:hypothetical protein